MSCSLISPLVILLFACSVLLPIANCAEPSHPTALSSDLSIVETSSLALNPSSLKQILLQALKQLFGAPMKLAKLFIQELNQMLKNRDFRELFDGQFIKQLLSKAPKRLFAYYDALMRMESHCLKRTVCDVAEFTSRRIPKWLEQILFIYFNTFSQTKPYYEVIVHGLTVKNCAFMYAECNPEEFLSRLRTNITQAIATTVAPFKNALQEFDSSLETPISHSPRPNMNRPVQLDEQQQQQQQLKQRPQAIFDQEDSENNRHEQFNETPDSEFEALMNDPEFRQRQREREQRRQRNQQQKPSLGQFGSF